MADLVAQTQVQAEVAHMELLAAADQASLL
jgi:hypothetical protein